MRFSKINFSKNVSVVSFMLVTMEDSFFEEVIYVSLFTYPLIITFLSLCFTVPKSADKICP